MIRTRPAGDAGLLAETDARPARLAAAIRQARLPDLIDVVPGAHTVLVTFRQGSWEGSALTDALRALDLPEHDPADEEVLRIPVVYDGEDLGEVARLTGMTTDEVIAMHSGGEYEVGWLGFSPGFGYLTGLDPRLAVPRLATPRVAVPAGSVAIAGELTAVYPGSSPGGWRLLGRTAARMWDQDREPPAMLSPGRRVRFEPVPSAPSPQLPGATRYSVETAGRARLEIVRSGPLATVQDLGRPGYADVGVPPSGAADAASLVTANRLAGNPDAAAALELTLGRAVVRCLGPARMATAGARAAIRVQADGGEATEVPFGIAFDVPAGSTVSIGAPAAGLRTYLAVAGGVDTTPVLGSRSADLLSGLGAPLRADDVLPVGSATPVSTGPVSTGPASPDQASPDQANKGFVTAGVTGPVRLPERGQPSVLRVRPGPRLDWFSRDALATLCGATYSVTASSNRTGLRLAGPRLPRARDAELPSEGLVTGSLEVPHDGQPILLLADHPTVGGYPVIAVVVSADLGLAGQLRPGDTLAFRPVLEEPRG